MPPGQFSAVPAIVLFIAKKSLVLLMCDFLKLCIACLVVIMLLRIPARLQLAILLDIYVFVYVAFTMLFFMLGVMKRFFILLPDNCA